jgi:ubiquinone/menaquinone biosynthesis C-methylase UbiE
MTIDKKTAVLPTVNQHSRWCDGLWWRLLRFGFRLLYNEMAWAYDLVAWVVSLGQWRNWQRAALHHLATSPGARVLELAHGTGNLQLDLYAAGYVRVGLDLSPFMGRIARRKLHRHYLPAPLVRGYGQQLPFADESFDAVVSTFPTPFIVEPATLREVCRVLKPGRRFVIVPSGILTGGGLLRDALETAYRVTGQREPWAANLEARFAEVGLTLEVLAEKCPYSIAYVLVATRLPDG